MLGLNLGLGLRGRLNLLNGSGLLNLLNGSGLLGRLNLRGRLGGRSYFRRYRNLEARQLRHLAGELVHHGAGARDVGIGSALLAYLVDDSDHRPSAF